MKRYKKPSPVTHAEVTPKLKAAIERNAAQPPRLVVDLLNTEAVNQFISPDTRGPQEPAGYAPSVDHFIDPETAGIARALVGVALVTLGFALGKFF